MKKISTSVLLVEDNVADAGLVKEALANAAGHPFSLKWMTQLAPSLEQLNRVNYEVILLDLALAGGV